MFGFGGTEKRKGAVAELGAKLANDIAPLHDVEKASVLILANAMLSVAGRTSGADFRADPVAAGSAAADRALKGLLAHRDRLAALAAEEGVAHPRHVQCHLRAAELACVTVGVGLDADVRVACGRAWKAAWSGSGRLRQGVTWIRRYEGAAGVSAVAVPDGTPEPNDLELAALGATVPAFLRKRAR